MQFYLRNLRSVKVKCRSNLKASVVQWLDLYITLVSILGRVNVEYKKSVQHWFE